MSTTSARRPIRFGLQIDPATCDMATIAGEAEAAGFDTISVGDHVGPDPDSPMVTLAYLASTSERITLGTLVLNNDMRNPVQVAWEAATIHELSGGRFELGLGAGHTPQEYAATGVDFDPAAVRKARLTEAVDIIGALFRGETVDHGGEQYRLGEARLSVVQPPPRILVGGNGTALLRHAAVTADIIGLQGLGRTKPDGHQHSVKFGLDHLENQLAVIADAARGKDEPPDLNALVQAVEITDDRERALAELVDRVEGLTVDDASATPYLAIGTVDEIAHQLIDARDRWGICYFSVRSLDLAPVITRVRRLE